MNIASAQITVFGTARDLLTAHREAIDTALRQLPFIAVTTFFDEGGKFCVDVKYDADDTDLDDQLPFLVTDAVQSAIPAESSAPHEAQSFTDSMLGEFFWDDELSSWEGELDLPELDKPLPLSFSMDDAIVPSMALLATGRDIAANLGRRELEWQEIAVRELLDTFNKHWNQGAPFTAQKFRDELSLTNALIRQDGSLSAIYWSGDLFTDHDIEVSIDGTGNSSATIIG